MTAVGAVFTPAAAPRCPSALPPPGFLTNALRMDATFGPAAASLDIAAQQLQAVPNLFTLAVLIETDVDATFSIGCPSMPPAV